MKELVVKLKVDGSGVFPAFATLEKRVNGMIAGPFARMKGALAGAFTVGALTAAGKRTLDWASHLTDVATRLGVSTEYIQEMDFALKQSGSSMDDLVGFTEKLNRARAAAIAGGPRGQKIAETFQTQFGIDATTLRGPVQPIIDAIAKQFETGNVQTLATALSSMGIKGAGALTAAFADGLADGRKTIREAGGVVSEDIVEQLDMAGDQLTAISSLIQSELAPALLTMIEQSLKLIGKGRETAGFVGAGTKDWTGDDWLKAIVKFLPTQAMEIGGRLVGADTSSSDWTARRDAAIEAILRTTIGRPFAGGKPFDYAAAGQVQQAEKEDWQSKLDAIREMAARRAERRKRSGVGSFGEPTSPLQKSMRAPRESSDSLVSVGNFLGTGRNALEAIGVETNTLLRGVNDKLQQLVDDASNRDALGLPEI